MNVFKDPPELCDEWARNEECVKNPWWMTRNCAVSCDSCVEATTAADTTPVPGGTAGAPVSAEISSGVDTTETTDKLHTTPKTTNIQENITKTNGPETQAPTTTIKTSAQPYNTSKPHMTELCRYNKT